MQRENKLSYKTKWPAGESVRFAYRLFCVIGIAVGCLAFTLRHITSHYGHITVAWVFARLILFAIGYIILATNIGCFPICFGGKRWNTFQ